MLLRARFFDDWRLSRIDEEVERLSVNSDTSVAVDTTSPSLHDAHRSASEERVLTTDDDDNDEPPLPPPPSPLPTITSPQTKKDVDELDVQHLRQLDEETEALRFLQVKYDTLGKVKVEKPQTSSSQQPLGKTSGADETVRLVGPQCRLNCDCSLTSAGEEQPRMALAVDSTSLRQYSTSSQSSVTDRRRPPPPPSTARICSCPTSESRASLQVSVDDHQHHHLHHHYHHRHHHRHQDQQQQQQLEQIAHHQRCGHTSASVVRHQSHHHEVSNGGHHSSLVCSCHGDHLGRGGDSGVIATRRQCCSMLSNAELFQIDLFYRSRKTVVYVSPCPAVLYFARANGGKSSSWRSAAAGVPVIVVDMVRIAVGPRLHVVLAERGTGFELWRSGLTDIQQYTVDETSTSGSGAAFHTVILPSGDVAGLCFDDAGSAGEFYRQLLKLDELYSISAGCSRSRKGKKTTTRSELMSAGARDIIARCIIACQRL